MCDTDETGLEDDLELIGHVPSVGIAEDKATDAAGALADLHAASVDLYLIGVSLGEKLLQQGTEFHLQLGNGVVGLAGVGFHHVDGTDLQPLLRSRAASVSVSTKSAADDAAGDLDVDPAYAVDVDLDPGMSLHGGYLDPFVGSGITGVAEGPSGRNAQGAVQHGGCCRIMLADAFLVVAEERNDDVFLLVHALVVVHVVDSGFLNVLGHLLHHEGIVAGEAVLGNDLLHELDGIVVVHIQIVVVDELAVEKLKLGIFAQVADQIGAGSRVGVVLQLVLGGIAGIDHVACLNIIVIVAHIHVVGQEHLRAIQVNSHGSGREAHVLHGDTRQVIVGIQLVQKLAVFGRIGNPALSREVTEGSVSKIYRAACGRPHLHGYDTDAAASAAAALDVSAVVDVAAVGGSFLFVGIGFIGVGLIGIGLIGISLLGIGLFGQGLFLKVSACSADAAVTACDFYEDPAYAIDVDLNPSVTGSHNVYPLVRNGVACVTDSPAGGEAQGAVQKGCRRRIVLADAFLVVTEEGDDNVLLLVQALVIVQIVLGCVLDVLGDLLNDLGIVGGEAFLGDDLLHEQDGIVVVQIHIVAVDESAVVALGSGIGAEITGKTRAVASVVVVQQLKFRHIAGIHDVISLDVVVRLVHGQIGGQEELARVRLHAHGGGLVPCVFQGDTRQVGVGVGFIQSFLVNGGFGPALSRKATEGLVSEVYGAAFGGPHAEDDGGCVEIVVTAAEDLAVVSNPSSQAFLGRLENRQGSCFKDDLVVVGDGSGICEDLDFSVNGVGGRAGKGNGTCDADARIVNGVTLQKSVLLASADDLKGGTGQGLSVVDLGIATRNNIELSGNDLQDALHVGHGVVVGDVTSRFGIADPSGILIGIPDGVGLCTDLGNTTRDDNGLLHQLVVQNQRHLLGVGAGDGVGVTGQGGSVVDLLSASRRQDDLSGGDPQFTVFIGDLIVSCDVPPVGGQDGGGACHHVGGGLFFNLGDRAFHSDRGGIDGVIQYQGGLTVGSVYKELIAGQGRSVVFLRSALSCDGDLALVDLQDTAFVAEDLVVIHAGVALTVHYHDVQGVGDRPHLCNVGEGADGDQLVIQYKGIFPDGL